MRGAALLLGLLVLAGCGGGRQEQASRGQRLAAERCASCHAIGPGGESAHPQAPPFRALHDRYPVEDLQEALAEGIVSGHPDMPVMSFSPAEITDLIAYLHTLEP